MAWSLYGGSTSSGGGRWSLYNKQEKQGAAQDYAQQVQRRISNYERRLSAAGQTPPPPKEQKSFPLKALDVLDRPGAAIRSAAMQAYQGGGLGQVLQAAKRGFTGREKVQGSDIIAEAARRGAPLAQALQRNKYAQGAAGFAADVLMDPLTYVTVGAAGVAKAGVSGAGKALAGQGARKYVKFAGVPLVEVTKPLQAASQALQRTGIPEKIGPIFSSRYVRPSAVTPEAAPQVQRAVNVIWQAPRTARGEQQIALDQIAKRFEGVSPEAARRAATAIEQPLSSVLRRKADAGRFGAMSDDVKAWMQAGVEEVERITKAIKERGGISPKGWDKESYQRVPARFRNKKGLPIDEMAAELGYEDGKMLLNALENLPTKKEIRESARREMLQRFRVRGPRVSDREFDQAFGFTKEAAKNLAEEAEAEAVQNRYSVKGAEKLPTDVLRAVRIAKEIGAETVAKDVAAGVEFGRIPNYIRHLYNDPPEKVAAVLNQWQKRVAAYNRKAGFQKERTIPTIEFAKKMGLHPVEDVRVLTAVRELEGIRQRAIRGMYQELKKIGGRVVRAADKAPPDWREVPAKELAGYKVHPEVARHLERLHDVFETDLGVRTLGTMLSQVQNFWKGLVTAPNPMFHVRNALGNVFNNFLGGVVNPGLYWLAFAIQRGGNDMLELGGRRISGQQVRALFRQYGLEGFGFFEGESIRGMRQQAVERFGQQGWRLYSPIEQGRRVGDLIETNAKLAHFLDKLSKGWSPEQAADSVRKYLFDYSDLTKAEEKIRNFIPFYTWTRKNIPLQIEALFTQPGKMAAVNKLVQNMASATETEESPQPDWLKNELAIPVVRTKDGQVVYLTPDLPLNNLNMIDGLQGTMRNVLGMVTPLAKVPIELAMGQQVFSGAPIEKYPGARGYIGNVEMPAKVAYGISQFGAVPRAAIDIAGAIHGQQPQSGNIPPRPQQIPGFGTFVRYVNPEREKVLQDMARQRQLGDYRRYLEEVKGIDVPTISELEKVRQRGRWSLYD